MRLIDVTTEPSFGVIISVNELNLADEFNDFLIEERSMDILFKVDRSTVRFYLGVNVSVEQARSLCEKFEAAYGRK